MGANQRLVQFDGVWDMLDVVGINGDHINSPINIIKLMCQQVLLGCINETIDFALVD